MHTRFRCLFCCLLLALSTMAAMPADAQFQFLGDVSGNWQGPSHSYLHDSLYQTAKSAIAERRFSLASRLIFVLNELSNERRLLIDLAIEQAKAGDQAGSDQTLRLVKDSSFRARVFTGTGAALAAQGRSFEARERFVKAFLELCGESDLMSRRALFDALINEEIAAGYRSMARITMSSFETQFHEAMLNYPPALMQFSRWNAEIGEIDEALRWYRLIPAQTWKDYDRSDPFASFGSAYTARSSAPDIAAAFLRAGNPEAAWALCDSMTSSREKRRRWKRFSPSPCSRAPYRTCWRRCGT